MCRFAHWPCLTAFKLNHAFKDSAAFAALRLLTGVPRARGEAEAAQALEFPAIEGRN
jgi:hypothetical protein